MRLGSNYIMNLLVHIRCDYGRAFSGKSSRVCSISNRIAPNILSEIPQKNVNIPMFVIKARSYVAVIFGLAYGPAIELSSSRIETFQANNFGGVACQSRNGEEQVQRTGTRHLNSEYSCATAMEQPSTFHPKMRTRRLSMP